MMMRKMKANVMRNATKQTKNNFFIVFNYLYGSRSSVVRIVYFVNLLWYKIVNTFSFCGSKFLKIIYFVI